MGELAGARFQLFIALSSPGDGGEEQAQGTCTRAGLVRPFYAPVALPFYGTAPMSQA